jgi:hypothetical protein
MASASDDFNRANESPMGGNWTSPNGAAADLNTNAILGQAGSRSDEYWNPTTFNNDQYSQVKVGTVSAGAKFNYAVVRVSSAEADKGYYLTTDGAELFMQRGDGGGTFTEIADYGQTVAANDVIKIGVAGTTLYPFKNGTPVGSTPDATYASGRTGFAVFDTATLDDWEGGDFALDRAIWQLDALTTPATVDLLAVVDDPSGTPATKKLALSDLIATLLTTNVVVQAKTVGSGTYTPTSGMKKVLAIGVGGGGGGAGGINTDSAGGGGGGGGTVIRLLTAAQIGASKSYVVGAGGAATSNGTATTLDSGTLLNAGAGQAGTAGAQAGALGVTALGGAGGTASNGDLNLPGSGGSVGTTYSGTEGMGGKGGSSVLGFGAKPGGVNVAGANGTAYGGGGSGGHASAASDRAGGAGADGILYLIEFLAA